MIGSRSMVGLSLLCALVFCAAAVQSASAAGTTAFSCVRVVGKTGEFTDADCAGKSANKTGEYEHKEFTPGTTTPKVGVGAITSAALNTTLLTLPVEVVCEVVTGSGKLTNLQPGGPGTEMLAKGEEIKVEYKKCTVVKPAKCRVAEPIVVNATSVTKTNLGAGNEMGTEFKPLVVGGVTQPFTEIEFKDGEKAGEKCALKNMRFPVTGTAISTSTEGGGVGARTNGESEFTAAMSGTLKIGGEAMTFSSRITTFEGENAVTGTTTNP